MRVNVIMPQLGESVAEGTIVKWLKKVGDAVQRDENILEISTDKVDSEIPAPASGILVEILAPEGETIPIGRPIAVIESDVAQAKVAAPSQAPPAGRRFYSPLVRSMAQAEGISDAELDRIMGSGAEGRLTKADLIAYLEQRKAVRPAAAPVRPAAVQVVTATAPPPSGAPTPASAPGEGQEIVPMDIMRRKIAEHMVRSAHTAAHVTSLAEADMSNVVRFRERAKKAFEEREGFKLTYTPIIVEAVVKALKEYPYLNASVEGENIILRHYVNFGVAVSLENGLIVPVVKRADMMNLLALARAINDLSTRARSKRLSPEEVHGATFTLTNPGIFGNLFGTPIINQPNVAILGTGVIKKRPVVIEGDAIAIRHMMYMSVTYDHRLIDGALGGQFLQRVVHYLEGFDPETTI